jgi:nicotinate-nucleotide adenylyltransferase
MRVGLYGGCFNPVHQGHLAAARGAAEELELDKVVFIPSGNPPLKGNDGLADGGHRAAMLEHAIAHEARMAISTAELDRTGQSFTVDTVRDLRRTFPAGAQLFFLLGDDCLDRLPQWKGIEELHTMVRFAILPRTGEPAALHDARLIRLHLPRVAASSSQIRASLAARKMPPSSLLAPEVADYIVRHNLYSAPAETACA